MRRGGDSASAHRRFRARAIVVPPDCRIDLVRVGDRPGAEYCGIADGAPRTALDLWLLFTTLLLTGAAELQSHLPIARVRVLALALYLCALESDACVRRWSGRLGVDTALGCAGANLNRFWSMFLCVKKRSYSVICRNWTSKPIIALNTGRIVQRFSS